MRFYKELCCKLIVISFASQGVLYNFFNKLQYFGASSKNLQILFFLPARRQFLFFLLRDSQDLEVGWDGFPYFPAFAIERKNNKSSTFYGKEVRRWMKINLESKANELEKGWGAGLLTGNRSNRLTTRLCRRQEKSPRRSSSSFLSTRRFLGNFFSQRNILRIFRRRLVG